MMRMKWMLTALIAMGFLATELAAPICAAAQGQVDVALSGLANYTSKSTGGGTIEVPTNGYGGGIDVRYMAKPLVGLNLGYTLNTMDITFSPTSIGCGNVCNLNLPPTTLHIKNNNLGFDYVASHKFSRLQAFAMAGVGFNITAAAASTYGVREVIRAAWNVGGGIDYGFSKHLGVRGQVRDYLMHPPNNSSLYNATGVFTSNIMPLGGIYYKF